jgi:hypothetical protein
LINVLRGFELERLVDPRLDLEDFARRIRPVVEAVVRASEA